MQRTTAHAAPEVLRAYDHHCRIAAQPAQDNYALGEMVLRMLTHVRAFPSAAFAVVLAAAAGKTRYP